MPPAAHLERRCDDGPGQDAQQGTSRLPRWPGRSGPSVPSAGRIGCAQVPWQVLGWFLTVQNEAGALHVVSWLMQNFKMEVWDYGWKCGFIPCVQGVALSKAIPMPVVKRHGGSFREHVCVFTGVTCSCVQQHQDIKA